MVLLQLPQENLHLIHRARLTRQKLARQGLGVAAASGSVAGGGLSFAGGAAAGAASPAGGLSPAGAAGASAGGIGGCWPGAPAAGGAAGGASPSSAAAGAAGVAGAAAGTSSAAAAGCPSSPSGGFSSFGGSSSQTNSMTKSNRGAGTSFGWPAGPSFLSPSSAASILLFHATSYVEAPDAGTTTGKARPSFFTSISAGPPAPRSCSGISILPALRLLMNVRRTYPSLLDSR